MPADHEESEDFEDSDPSEDSDADDPVFVFGRPSADLTPEEQQQRQRSRRFALVALAGVVVIVALAITLVSLLVDTSGGPPEVSTPAAAAQQWARDLVHGDSAGRRSLECSTGAQGTDVLRLVLAAATDARADTAKQVDSDTWHVPVSFLGPDGRVEASYTVDVVHERGRYLVC